MKQADRRLDQSLIEAPLRSGAFEPNALPNLMRLEEVPFVEEQDARQVASIKIDNRIAHAIIVCQSPRARSVALLSVTCVGRYNDQQGPSEQHTSRGNCRDHFPKGCHAIFQPATVAKPDRTVPRLAPQP